ncbi:MAG: aldo/keto reductase [SAR324 cluster bacterium]|nr:aldo/keto reductase [SAR324 cluster bacterium]
MQVTRRTVLQAALATMVAALQPAWVLRAIEDSLVMKPIPSTGERIPVVGLGSSVTFNVGEDSMLLDECAAVMAAFFAAGGRMIDCSPMYGSSQPTIGSGLNKLGYPRALFSAEKVWTANSASGPAQIERSRAFWGVSRFDLVQVHNLLAWERHLQTLFAMKANGALRYVGITTSHSRRHREIEHVMATQPIDFVQVTYNVLDREVEARILPLARERGIAVIANRPFRQGHLIRQIEHHSLPHWVAETGASTWAKFILKFIVSHPVVTCAIPATTRVDHVRENMTAAMGILPDATLRRRMAAYVAQL